MDEYLTELIKIRKRLLDQLDLLDDAFEREALDGKINGLTLAINLYLAYDPE